MPADVDLRGLQYMPLFGERLFGSETWISASAEAKVAALRLWWRSYAHELPAGSLPDNDQLLADYAGYGVAVKAWRRIREQAMRGWVKCSDGRLYHKTVAEIALESWASRQRNREKQERWRAKQRQRDADQTPPETSPVTVTEPSRNAGEGKGREGKGESNSEANASGGAPDLASRIFGEGLDWLRKTTGKPDDDCRKILGGWRKKLSDEAVIAAIGRAQREAVTHPESWFSALVKSKQPGNSGGKRRAGAADWN